MAGDARTKEKGSSLDETSGCAKPGIKRRGRIEVRWGGLNRRDPRREFSEVQESLDSEGWREPGPLIGSERAGPLLIGHEA